MSGRREGPIITLYEKTMDFIRKLISDQSLGPGDRLPSESEIAVQAGVSLMTVRRAMAELSAAGVLQRSQGKGTFVRSNRVHTESTIIGGLRETLALQGIVLETKVLSLSEEEADVDVAQRLAIAPGTAIWSLVRLRHFDGVPAVREVAIIPRVLAPELDRHLASPDTSLYVVLSTIYGLVESVEEQTLIARPATKIERHDLGLESGSYVVEVTGVSTSLGGTAFDCFTMTFVASKFSFTLRSSPTADPIDL
ncbi:MAG: GntR family transcriptional regulator [Acidimicrobiales bacterium]